MPINCACKLKSNLAGSKLECQCFAKCKLIGSSVRVCMSNGNWSGPINYINDFVGIGCSSPHSLPNGLVTLTNHTFEGSKANYSCGKRFVLKGANVRVCQSSGKRSEAAPVCLTEGRSVEKINI